MKISIVVLSYNVKNLMEAMLESLDRSIHYARNKIRDLEFETIIVDNGSYDGVVEVIKRFKWVKLIENHKNVGFAKGNNIGVEHVSNDSNYVLFLNPDIIIEKDTLAVSIKKVSKIDELGIYTCRVELWSGGLDWDCHRGFPTPWSAFCYFSGLEGLLGHILPNVFGQYHLMHKDIGTAHEIDVCLGAFMLIPYKVGELINWWPTDYFLNGEDVDLCYQVKRLHNKVVFYDPESRIIHYKGASKGTKKESINVSKADNFTRKTQINAGANAFSIFYNKYYRDEYPWFVNILVKTAIALLRIKRLILNKE